LIEKEDSLEKLIEFVKSTPSSEEQSKEFTLIMENINKYPETINEKPKTLYIYV
jgi:hypothetical protein